MGMDGQVDGQVDGWMDGWMEWMDGCFGGVSTHSPIVFCCIIVIEARRASRLSMAPPVCRFSEDIIAVCSFSSGRLCRTDCCVVMVIRLLVDRLVPDGQAVRERKEGGGEGRRRD